jgi:hypothetical protein
MGEDNEQEEFVITFPVYLPFVFEPDCMLYHTEDDGGSILLVFTDLPSFEAYRDANNHPFRLGHHYIHGPRELLLWLPPPQAEAV